MIRIWGQIVTHKPVAGSPQDVLMVRNSPPDTDAGVLMVLFGTLADSNFNVRPVKNDLFDVDGVEYRAFNVSADWAGGTPELAGIEVSLVRP